MLKTMVQMPVLATMLAMLCLTILPNAGLAATAAELDKSAKEALQRFQAEVPGAKELLKRSAGELVFPKVYKAGFIVGGETGEGVLRAGNKTLDYYNISAASYGLQIGAQSMTLIMLFLEQTALDKFRAGSGWEVGNDLSVAVVDQGQAKSLSTATFDKPVVAFVLDEKGLMANMALEGTKFTKIKKDK
ncbi:MAG: YSC84-related protein [Desulfocurvibacter africanus]